MQEFSLAQRPGFTIAEILVAALLITGITVLVIANLLLKTETERLVQTVHEVGATAFRG